MDNRTLTTLSAGNGFGRRTQSGAMLIEVMIAGLLLAIGVTGLSAAQLGAMRSVNQAEIRHSLLTWQDTLLDQLRLHRTLAASGAWNAEISASADIATLDAAHPLLAASLEPLSGSTESVYLHVTCGAEVQPLHCSVCVGEFSATDRAADGTLSELPGLRVCGEHWL